MSLKEEYHPLPVWRSQDAKAEFSRLVRESNNQDQFITNGEQAVAVVISKRRYDELTQRPGALLDFFKNAPLPEVGIGIQRNQDLPKEIDI